MVRILDIHNFPQKRYSWQEKPKRQVRLGVAHYLPRADGATGRFLFLLMFNEVASVVIFMITFINLEKKSKARGEIYVYI